MAKWPLEHLKIVYGNKFPLGNVKVANDNHGTNVTGKSLLDCRYKAYMFDRSFSPFNICQ